MVVAIRDILSSSGIRDLGVCWALSARGWLQAYRAAAEAGDPLGGVLEKELLREVTALVDASGALRQQALSQKMTQVCLPLAPRGLGFLVLEAQSAVCHCGFSLLFSLFSHDAAFILRTQAVRSVRVGLTSARHCLRSISVWKYAYYRRSQAGGHSAQ